MDKKTGMVAGVIVLVIVVAGAFALIHHNMNSMTAGKTASQTNLPAVNNAVLKTTMASKVGQYLTDASGKALYTYGGDTAGISNCSGECLADWPAYTDSGATTGLPAGVGTIKRSDNGAMQYTFNGQPLYYFTDDSGSAVTGDGVSGFHVAKPAAAQSSASSTATTPTPTPAQSTSGGSSNSNPY